MKNPLLFIALILCCFANPQAAQAKSGYHAQRATLFEVLPVHPDDIVFLGNSLTDGAEWNELFPGRSIKNRGISGDTTDGVIKRLSAITNGNPAKIFLLIGINNVSRSQSPDSVAADIDRILHYIATYSPGTKVYLQSLLPVNDTFGSYKGHTSRWAEVPEFNRQIRAVADKRGVTFIDLFPHFVDQNGKLDTTYTNDGLHLLGNGYLRWADIIRPYVEE